MESSAMLGNPATDVILHAFDWCYADVMKNAPLIQELGYKSVLVSPAMKSLRGLKVATEILAPNGGNVTSHKTTV